MIPHLKCYTRTYDTSAYAFKKLPFFCRKLCKSPSTVNLMAYKTQVRPTLEYAEAAWIHCLKKDTEKENERIQRNSARIVLPNY